MKGKKTAYALTAVLLILSLLGLLIGCQDDDVVQVQGVQYGQYGNAWFHGSIIVDNDITVSDFDLTTVCNPSIPKPVFGQAEHPAHPCDLVREFSLPGKGL